MRRRIWMGLLLLVIVFCEAAVCLGGFRWQIKKTYPAFGSCLLSPFEGPRYFVPGLYRTISLRLSDDRPGAVKDMDPQGLAVTKSYLLISAYSRAHQYSSVIYVLDRQTGRHLKTVVLKGADHVGGLAYDAAHHKIWVTTRSVDRHAQLSMFSLKKLKAYRFDGANPRELIYDQVVDIGDIRGASYLACHRRSLYVGLFNRKKDSWLVRFDIRADGRLDTDYPRWHSGKHSLAVGEAQFPIEESVQGIAFYRDKILLSQSYGAKNARLLIYTAPKSALDLSKPPGKVVVAPPYMEQIAVFGNRLGVVFESGAAAYRQKPIVVVREVLQLDLEKLVR